MASDESMITSEYESKDINLKGLAMASLALLIALVAIVLLLKPIFNFRVANHVVMTADRTVIDSFPNPRLQPHPKRDWQAFRADEERILTTYGWVDRERGIVRVPITEAMDMYVRQQTLAPSEE